MSDAFNPASPTRRSARVHHEVMVGVSSEAGTFSGWGTNLSVGGVFVNSHHAPPLDTRVHILLPLPRHSEGKPLGRGAWAPASGAGGDEAGVGIEVPEVREGGREVGGEVVAKVSQ